jgi:mono/diheme cytochrome c family protein
MKLSAIFKTAVVVSAVALVSFMAPEQEKKKGAPWQVPAEYKNMKNPHATDASLLRVGRTAYGKHCRSCHGRTGQGDGPMAAQLETFPGDFTKKAWQDKYNDGEIYYQSFVGRGEMPNFEKTIPDVEERWAIVNLIRSLKE